jgi:hypothetical protein
MDGAFLRAQLNTTGWMIGVLEFRPAPLVYDCSVWLQHNSFADATEWGPEVLLNHFF